MDKLVQYIEMRSKKYGHCSGNQAVLSSYYTFGNIVVRISDHIKYGKDSTKTYDYCFVIQPNDTYIFTSKPTDENKLRMYVKLITLEDAKKFIKTLHDFAINFDGLTEIYSPEGWNRTSDSSGKIKWEDFVKTHLNDKEKLFKIKVIDQIDLIVNGKVGKGNFEKKLERIPDLFNKMSKTQYDTLISKINKFNEKNEETLSYSH